MRLSLVHFQVVVENGTYRDKHTHHDYRHEQYVKRDVHGIPPFIIKVGNPLSLAKLYHLMGLCALSNKDWTL